MFQSEHCVITGVLEYMYEYISMLRVSCLIDGHPQVASVAEKGEPPARRAAPHPIKHVMETSRSNVSAVQHTAEQMYGERPLPGRGQISEWFDFR